MDDGLAGQCVCRLLVLSSSPRTRPSARVRLRLRRSNLRGARATFSRARDTPPSRTGLTACFCSGVRIAALENAKKEAMMNDEFERCASIRDEINAVKTANISRARLESSPHDFCRDATRRRRRCTTRLLAQGSFLTRECWPSVPQLRRQMATGGGSSQPGTSTTRNPIPDSDDNMDSEWDMDEGTSQLFARLLLTFRRIADERPLFAT